MVREESWGLAPTFLHQLLVDQRPAHYQQHHQEYKGQDDACHSAWGQARWVWVLAWTREVLNQSQPWGATQRAALAWISLVPPECS